MVRRSRSEAEGPLSTSPTAPTPPTSAPASGIGCGRTPTTRPTAAAAVVPPVEPLGDWRTGPAAGAARALLDPGGDGLPARARAAAAAGRWSDPDAWARAARRAPSTAATRSASATAARSCCRSRRPCWPSWPSSDCAVGDHPGCRTSSTLNGRRSCRAPRRRVGAAAGGEKLGATLYESIPAGASRRCTSTMPTRRCCCGLPPADASHRRRRARARARRGGAFPSGRRGVHRCSTARTARAGPDRSTMRYPEVVEHPDSDKVLAISGRPDETAAMFLAFRGRCGARHRRRDLGTTSAGRRR